MGSLYFLMETLARHHFVTLSAVATVNRAAALAVSALDQQLKSSFDAGLIRIDDSTDRTQRCYRNRADLLLYRSCSTTFAGLYQDTRQYETTDLVQRTHTSGIIEWFSSLSVPPYVDCYFGDNMSCLVYHYRQSTSTTALDDVAVQTALTDTIPSVFGSGNGTGVNFCFEEIQKYRITVSHNDKLSNAAQRRFVYEKMRGALLWYLHDESKNFKKD